MNEQWYRDGLRFECTQCGQCCSGTPGFVWVNPQEIADLAHVVDMTVEAFRNKFVRKVGSRYSLVEYPDGDCIFLDPQKRNCKVYQARPTQCRTWPFWASNLKTRKTWQETCNACPGAGQGKLYTLQEIKILRVQKRV